MRIHPLIRTVSALALITSWNTLHAMQNQNLTSEPVSGGNSSATRAVAAVPVIPSSTSSLPTSTTGSRNPRVMERLGRSLTPGRSTTTTTTTTSTPSAAAPIPTASRPAQSPARRVSTLYELQEQRKLQKQTAGSSSANTATAAAPTRPGVASTAQPTRSSSAPRRPVEQTPAKALPGANISTLPSTRPTSTERTRPSAPGTSASTQPSSKQEPTFETLMKQMMERKKTLEQEQKNTVQAREKALAAKETHQQALDKAKADLNRLQQPEAAQYFDAQQLPAIKRMFETDEKRATQGVEKAQRDIQQAEAILERIQTELGIIRGPAPSARAVAPVPVVKPLPTAAPARPAAPQPARVSNTPAARAEVERLQAALSAAPKTYKDSALREYSEKARIARQNLRELEQQAPEMPTNPEETPRTTRVGVSQEQLDAARLKVAQWEEAEKRVQTYFGLKNDLQRAQDRLARAEEQDRLAQQGPTALPLGAPLPVVRDIEVAVGGQSAPVAVAVTPQQLQNRLKAIPTTSDSIWTLVKETRQYLGRPAAQTLSMSAAYHNALYHHYRIFHKAISDKELPQEVNLNWMEMMTQIQTLRSKMEEEGLKPCGENDARRACEGLRGDEYPL